jgi:ParB family transcriptional regulator, chromosome partitioning protein
MTKKNSLGRGLGALIEAPPERSEGGEAYKSINEISIRDIESNPFQPRTEFDEESMQELASSIRQLGIIQPITVRELRQGKYQIITGERRWRAATIAGLETIPAYIRTADDQGLLEMALVENIQREDLNPMEVAISYQRLVEEIGMTQEVLSERVGKKRSTITNYIRLLKLPPEIQLAIREQKLSMGHARAIINVEDKDIQMKILNKILSQELSVRATEELVRKRTETKNDSSNQTDKSSLPKEYEDLRNHLSRFFEATVEFKRNNKGTGKIVIPFASDEDLERIVGILDKINA